MANDKLSKFMNSNNTAALAKAGSALVDVNAYLTNLREAAYQAEALDTAPVGYGVTDFAKDWFTTAMVSRNETNYQTRLGDIIKSENDSQLLEKAKLYIANQIEIENNLLALREDPKNAQQYKLKALNIATNNDKTGLTDAYNTLVSKGMESKPDEFDINFLKRDRKLQYEELTKYSDEINKVKELNYNEALEYKDNAKYWLDKHKVSDYFNYKNLSGNFDFTDIDTYLYKTADLVGSSATSLKSQLAGYIGSALAMGAASTIAAGIEYGSAGLATPAAVGVLGLGTSVASNIYSRSEESKAEVFLNYKSKVIDRALKSGVLDKATENAKLQLIQLNANNPSYKLPTDEEILDLMITGQLKTGNEKFDDIRINSLKGMEALYNQNMALSGWDVAEQMILVAPIGALAKSSKLLRKLPGVSKLEKGTERLSGLKKLISDRIDDVITAGIEKVPANLAKTTTRKWLTSLAGKTAITSIGEGTEEGIQYILGKEFNEADNNYAPNLVLSWVNNIGTGARAAFAALTPFDSVYSDDKEFMNSFKGGALLGGLMSGLVSPIASYKSLSDQVKADELISSLYANRLDERDKVDKSIAYSRMGKSNKDNEVMNSFDKLKELNVDGLSASEIDEEQQRAKRVMNLSKSSYMINKAKSNGINPNSDDYDIYVALDTHYTDLIKETGKNLSTQESYINNILNREDVNAYIDDLTKGTDLESSKNEIKELILLKAKLDKLNEIKASSPKEGLSNIESKYNLKTNKADVISFDNILDNIISETNKQYTTLKDNISDKDKTGRITEQALLIPTAHDDLSKVVENESYLQLDRARALTERELLNTQGKKSSKHNIVQDKINKYKNTLTSNENLVQTLLDNTRGVQPLTTVKELEVTHPIIESAPETTVEPPLVLPTATVEELTAVEPILKPSTPLSPIEPTVVQELDNTPVATSKIDNTRDDSELNKYLEPLRKRIQDYNKLNITATSNTIANKNTIRRNREHLVDKGAGRSDEELELGKQVRLSPSLDTRAGKAFTLATTTLESLYRPIMPLIINKENNRLFNYGYNEGYFTSALLSVEGTDLENDPLINYYQDLRDSKNRLEEAIFEGNTDDIDKYSKEVLGIIDQYNSKLEDDQAALNDVIKDNEPIVNTNNSITTAESDETGDVTPTVEQPVENLPTVDNTEVQPTVPTIEEDIEQYNKPLEYDSKVDPYSHQLKYYTFQDAAYDGYDNYESGAALGLVITNDDFIKEAKTNITVKPFYNKYTKQLEDGIYFEIEYKGKKYVAAVNSGTTGFDRNKGFQRLPFAQQQMIRQNLLDLRNKIKELYTVTLKDSKYKIIPTRLGRTNGIINSDKDSNGAPINRNLLDIPLYNISDPYEVTPENTPMGVATGPLGGEIIRSGSKVYNIRGNQLGAVYYIYNKNTDGKLTQIPIRLNVKPFKDNKDIAELILKLVTNTTSDNYTTKSGVVTPFQTNKLLQLIVNYGAHTATDPASTKLNPSQLQQRIAKQFFTDINGDIVIGTTSYRLADLTVNDEGVPYNKPLYDQAQQYIMDNFHWSIDEDNLWKWFAGDNTLEENHPLGNLKAWFKVNDKDKLVIIPGQLEFTRKDTEYKGSGISMAGWYIKNSILQSDINPKLPLRDANLYVQDVALLDNVVDKLTTIANNKIVKEEPIIEKAVEENKIADTDLTLDDIFKDLGPDFSVPESLLSNDDTINKDNATTYLKTKLGLTDDQILFVPIVIEVTRAGMSVLGRTLEDSILLSEVAPLGVEYHEAWHRVSNLLISDSKRNKIFNKVRKGNKLSDRQVDEMLAEQYREFMLTQASTIDFETTNWFRKIYNFVKTIAKVGSYNLAKIYYDINTGKYANVKASQSNIDRFKSIYKDGLNFEHRGTTFKTIPNTKVYNSIIDALTYALLRINFGQVENIRYEDLDNIRFEQLKKLILNQVEKRPTDVYNEILDKFDSDILPTIKQDIKNLGLRTIDKEEEDANTNIESGDVDKVNIGEHTMASYEVSRKDNAPSAVKFFFKTVTKYKYNDKGDVMIDTEPYTGLPRFVDSGKAWKKALNKLHDISSVEDMVSRILLLATNDLYFKALSLKLRNLDPVRDELLFTQLYNTVRSSKHQFITGKIDRTEDGKNIVKVIDNNVDIKSITYPKIWSQSLFYSSNIFKQTDNGDVYTSENALNTIKRIIKRYNSIKTAFVLNNGIFNANGLTFDFHKPEDLIKLKKQIVNLLNTIGISVDTDTLDDMMNSGKVLGYSDPVLNDQYTILNDFIVAGTFGLKSLFDRLDFISSSVTTDYKIPEILMGDNKIKPQEFYNTSGFVKALAQSYAKVHLSSEELKSLSAEGNILYPISQNNFAFDRVNELNTDQSVVDQLNSVVYNRGSLILEQLNSRNKPKLSVETFVNFRTADATDQGRDYFGITDREDYISKMTMSLSDRILFPTVADKKTYHVIRGAKLPHERILWDRIPNGISFGYRPTFGDETISRFIEYAKAELATIELTINDLDPANPNRLLKHQLIKNYHTDVKYKVDGETYLVSGNGTRFRFLTGVYLNVNGKEKFIDFNAVSKAKTSELALAQAKLNLQLAKDYFFGDQIDQDTKKQLMSTLIAKGVQQEVKKAVDLGLISTVNEENSIYGLRNVLLDDKALSNRASHYLKSNDPIVRDNAEGYAIYDMLTDYTVNSIISINEVEKLFSGDPAFYKWAYNGNGLIDNSIDKIKRLGALTSTGTNNRLDFEFNNRTNYTVTELNDIEVGSKQFDVLKLLFVQGNLVDALSQMLNMPIDEARDIVNNTDINELSKLYPEVVKFATIKADSEVNGYSKGINIADAAVYVSPLMYRDMMRMIGEWSPEVEDAFLILINPDTELKWQDEIALYRKVMKASLKPLKYMAFGTRFNEIAGIGIPYFNKMALFPLFKTIATGDIKPLYDRMVDSTNPIDMVMFNSAVKAGSRAPLDYYTDNDTAINDLSKLTTYTLDFKYLRQQLATDPHIHEEQMAGTQFLKVGLSNIQPTGFYGNDPTNLSSGREITSTIFNAMKELSDRGRSEIEDVIYDENGNINMPSLSKMISDDAKESDANDNIITGLTVEDGKFKIPLSALSGMSVESRFISMINKKTIDIHMPGGSFIQRSDFGIKDGDGLTMLDESYLNRGRRLNMLNEDGSMDSIVSINLFKHIIPNYNRMAFSQAKQWLIDNNIIGDNATPNAIGYRIPTQAVASISPLKFVDVLPEIMGDTIVLPDEFTKLTGSDFDVDKLYLARYAYTDGIKDEFDNTLLDAWKVNSTNAIKNKMLDMYMKVLTTRDNTHELKASIDTATSNVKAVLADIESSVTSKIVAPFAQYLPSYQEDRKSEYTGGKAGIGPMALNNAHHILTLIMETKMQVNPFTEALKLTDLSRTRDYSTISNQPTGRILDWLSAMINAFVDIAKDPYIVRLNVNPWTYNMVAFLLRTGKGKLTFYFMSQPILKEMANEVLKTKGKYGIDQTKSQALLEKEAINRVLDRYDPNSTLRRKYIGLDNIQLSIEFGDLFSTYMKDGKETSRTRELILHPDDVSNYRNELVRMYYAFKYLKLYADDMANLVKYSKVDTKKMGNTFSSQRTFKHGLEAMMEKSMFEDGEVKRFFEDSFLQKKLQNSIDFGANIFKDLLLTNTDGFIELQDNILYRLGRISNATDKILKPVINTAEAAIKTNFFNDHMKSKGITARQMLYGNNTIAKRLLKLRNDISIGKYPELLGNDGNIANDMLDFILPNISIYDGTNLEPDFIDVSSMFSDDKLDANNLINSWLELLESEYPVVREFADDLVDYAFITSGDNSGANSFFEYVPNNWRTSSGYAKYMLNTLDSYSLGKSTDFSIDDLFANNWHNNNLVKLVSLMYKDKEGTPYSFYTVDSTVPFPNTNQNYPLVIVGKRTNNSKYKEGAINPAGQTLVTKFIDGIEVTRLSPIYHPYIKLRIGSKNTPDSYALYKLIGYTTEMVDDTELEYPIYNIVLKKGYKYRGHTIVEYGRNDRHPFNNIPLIYDGVSAINDSSILNDVARLPYNNEYKSRFGTLLSNMNTIENHPSYKEIDIYNDYNIDETVDEVVEDTIPTQDNNMNTTDNAIDIKSLFTTNDEGIKSMYIYNRREDLTKLIEGRSDLNADEVMQQFDDIISNHNGNSDSLNNELVKFICNL